MKKLLMLLNCGAGAMMTAACMSQKCPYKVLCFHKHEEVTRIDELSPETLRATTIAIGLFVSDPHAVMAKAVAAGGTELDTVKDYDYDYRQGCFADSFGITGFLKKRLANLKRT